METTEIVEAPVIVAAGKVDINLNQFAKVTVLLDDKGQTYVNIDELTGKLYRMYDIQRGFAKRQAQSLAPQASYDAGKAMGMEEMLRNIGILEAEAKSLPVKP